MFKLCPEGTLFQSNTVIIELIIKVWLFEFFFGLVAVIFGCCFLLAFYSSLDQLSTSNLKIVAQM